MDKYDQLFLQLLYTLHASGMQLLGKIKNPMTDKIEKNLPQAQQSIDMLEMLKEKTKGNLSEQLVKLLDTFLTEMRLNYIDELNKESSPSK